MAHALPERSDLRSPFRSAPVLITALRARVRRHRGGRALVVIALLALIVIRLDAATGRAVDARNRWLAGPTVWVINADIAAGHSIEPGVAQPVDAPAGLVPDGAVAADPTGHRARVDLVAGEIVVIDRLSDAASTTAARTPPGMATVTLDRTSELLGTGDRVDLHDLADGRRLATDGIVVATGDRDLAVAVDIAEVGAVVRSLGAAGVVAVLRSG